MEDNRKFLSIIGMIFSIGFIFYGARFDIPFVNSLILKLFILAAVFIMAVLAFVTLIKRSSLLPAVFVSIGIILVYVFFMTTLPFSAIVAISLKLIALIAGFSLLAIGMRKL